MPASDPVLEALRRAPHGERAHLDNLIALYDHCAADEIDTPYAYAHRNPGGRTAVILAPRFGW